MTKMDGLVGTNETRIAMLEKQNEALLHAVQQYEAGITQLETQIETLVQVAQQNEKRIATLETRSLP